MSIYLAHLFAIVLGAVGVSTLTGAAMGNISAGLIGAGVLFFIVEGARHWRNVYVFAWSCLHFWCLTRVSVAGLLRVRIENKYVLVWSQRNEQYQPIGGAYRRIPNARLPFDSLPDPKYPERTQQPDELRFAVKGHVLPDVLAWIASGKAREVSPWREFDEELLQTSLLDRETFGSVLCEFSARVYEGPRKPKGAPYRQLRVFEIHDAHLTPEQTEAFRNAMEAPGQGIRGFTSDRISAALGMQSANAERIGGHTIRLLIH